MKMCLPWIPARSGEQDTDEMRVSELVCILQYAHTAAIGQMLFERRENKNATPEDFVSDFLTGFFTRPRRWRSETPRKAHHERHRQAPEPDAPQTAAQPVWGAQ